MASPSRCVKSQLEAKDQTHPPEKPFETQAETSTRDSDSCGYIFFSYCIPRYSPVRLPCSISTLRPQLIKTLNFLPGKPPKAEGPVALQDPHDCFNLQSFLCH